MTSNRISRFNGSTWDPIYDSAASLSTVIAGSTSLPVTSTANTLTITGGTGVTVAGATGPNTITLSIGQSIATTDSPTFTNLSLSNTAGTFRQLSYKTSGTLRWNWYTDNASETGSNAGSNLFLSRHDDAGAALSVAMSINRSTGNIVIGALAYVNGSGSNPVLFAGGGTQTARSVIISTAAPSGGSSGDIWMRYV